MSNVESTFHQICLALTWNLAQEHVQFCGMHTGCQI